MLGSEFAAGRHLQLGVLMTDGLDQQAFLGLAGNEGRAAVATLEDGRSTVEQQAAALFPGFAGMAVLTLLDEQRANLLLEEVAVFRGDRRNGRRLRSREWGTEEGEPEQEGLGVS